MTYFLRVSCKAQHLWEQVNSIRPAPAAPSQTLLHTRYGRESPAAREGPDLNISCRETWLCTVSSWALGTTWAGSTWGPHSQTRSRPVPGAQSCHVTITEGLSIITWQTLACLSHPHGEMEEVHISVHPVLQKQSPCGRRFREPDGSPVPQLILPVSRHVAELWICHMSPVTLRIPVRKPDISRHVGPSAACTL